MLLNYGDKLYQTQGSLGGWGSGPTNIRNQNDYNMMTRLGLIKPFELPNGQQTPQPTVPVQTPQDLQNQYSRLASQASNALNGGLLGYQPSEIRAAGTNPQTFTGPSNSFRFPFGLLNGMGG